MENYSLLEISSFSYNPQTDLYNNGLILTNKKKFSKCKSITQSFDSEITEIINYSFFVNYEYEILFIDKTKNLYKYNKHTKSLSEIGQLDAKVFKIKNNDLYTLIITSQSIMVFTNGYFDLINEINSTLEQNIISVEWSTKNCFCILTSDKVYFYDYKLNLLSSLKLSSHCCVFIERYNYWCIVNKDKIYFIEDNGSVYAKIDNQHMDIQSCYYMKDNILIFSNCTTIWIYKRNNGIWQLKNENSINGQLIDLYKNIIVCKCNKYIKTFIVKSYYTQIGNTFLVSDGSSVLVYEFDKKKSANWNFKLEFKNNIKNISVYRNTFCVHMLNTYLIFDCEFNLIQKIINEVSNLILYKTSLIPSSDTKILKRHVVDGQLIEIYKNGNILFENQIYVFEPIKEYYTISVSNLNSDDIKDAMNNELKKDLSSKISLFILYKNILYKSTELLKFEIICENVTFFFISKNGLFVVKNEYLEFDKTQIVVDKNFKILGTTDMEIYGYSRYGSIDTYYDTRLVKQKIETVFKNGDYTKCINLMKKFNLKFNLTNINFEKMQILSESNLIYLIDQIIDAQVLLLDLDISLILKYAKLINSKFYFDFSIFDSSILGLKKPDSELSNSIYKFISEGLNNILKNTSILVRYLITSPESTIPTKSNILSKDSNILFNFIYNFKSNPIILSYLFIKCKRADLAILTNLNNLQKIIDFCKKYISNEEIKSSVIKVYMITRNINLVEDVYTLLNEESHLINNLQNNYSKVLEIFGLHNELIFYLIEDKDFEQLKYLIKRYNLYDEILIYIYITVNEELINIYIEGVSVEKKLFLYFHLNRWDKYLDICVLNCLYKEFYTNKQKYTNSTFILEKEEELIGNLTKSKKYYDLGQLYELYLVDRNISLEYFLKSGSIRDIYRMYKLCTRKLNIRDMIIVLDNQISVVNKLIHKYSKYKRRLQNIQHNIEDDTFSVTSVCLTNRGIPGNLYEYEFYLEKVNEILVQLINWYEKSEMCLEIINSEELFDCMFNIKQIMKDSHLLFNVSYERSKEKVECINLERIFK